MSLFRRPKTHTLPSDRLKVEKYQPWHRDELVALIQTRFAETGTPVDLADHHHDLIDPDGTWRADGGEFMVLTFDGHVIGSLAVKPLPEPDRIEFNWFYLDPAYENKGYSAPLYRWAMRWALKSKAKFAELWSTQMRPRAHHLYRGLGFNNNGIKRLIRKNPEVYSLYFEMEITPDLIKKLRKRFERLP